MKSKFLILFSIFALTLPQYLSAQALQTRNVSAFTEISLKIGATVHLTQGNVQLVEVKGAEGTLNRLITEINDRKLVLRFPTDTWFSKWNPGPIEVFITMPQIDALQISGSGSIISEDQIDSRILNLVLSGSGDIKLPNLKAEKVSIILSGSGNIHLAGSGKATELKGALTGSGNIKAIDFQSETVKLKVAGSGNCYVNVIKELEARLAGSGNVIYRGAPLVDTGILGSGQVKKE